MEDDDEFGDLYTDVLQPFSSAAASSSAPLNPSSHLHTVPDRSMKTVKDDSGKDSTSNDGVHSKQVVNQCDEKIQDGEMQFDIDDGINSAADDVPPLISDYGGETGLLWEKPVTEIAEEEEESESDDDLQIVLNDTRTSTRSGIQRAEDNDEEDDDEDGEPLVIVADGDTNKVTIEENWGIGDDGLGMGGGSAAERREGTEKTGGPGAGVAGQKIGYSNYGYHHPFHSQYKYVRPGAAPLPGSTTNVPGSAPGQVRPQINMNLAPGRGRGDWRPGVNKNAPTAQKPYHTGFAATPWTNNAAGRGAGLDFTLPSHKTIFDVDIDSFEEKPWRYPGVDMSDFFNFDMNEETWKDYSKKLGQHRLETTMQSKIRVYEVGRGEMDYDPDMPPELAAAAAVHDAANENSHAAKTLGLSDVAKGSIRVRQLPTGRAIQVETGLGDRLPSIDTRPPRIRDCDAIIEIVCQGSLDSDEHNANGEKNGPQDGERASDVVEVGLPRTDAGYPDGYCGYKGKTNDEMGDGDKIMPQYDSSKHTSAIRDGKSLESSKREKRSSRSPQNRKPVDAKVEKQSPTVSSPGGFRDANDADFHPPLKSEDGVAKQEKNGSDLPENESKPARSSEDSKARSGSSRGNQNWHDSAGEEVLQGRSKTLLKNHDNHRKKDRENLERNHAAPRKDEPFAVREGDPPPHPKHGSYDRRRELEAADATGQRRNEDSYRRNRNDDARIKDRGDDAVSRYPSKARDADRNGSYRDRDDGFKLRHEADDHHGKRRKEDEYVRREEGMHGHRDSRRRRDWDDSLDSRKRSDNPPSSRHKEASDQRDRSGRSREREENSRSKHSNDENLSRREREAAARNVAEKASNPQPESQMKNSDRANESKKRPRSDDDRPRRNQTDKKPRPEVDGQKKHRDGAKKQDDNNAGQRKNKEQSDSHPPPPPLPLPLPLPPPPPPPAKEGGKEANKRQKDGPSSEEEHEDSKRGRSKLERWNSHTEEHPSKKCSTAAGADAAEGAVAEPIPAIAETKESESKNAEGRHLDNVEKLKKRSERFKVPLPMPSEKEGAGTKKTEGEGRSEKNASEDEVKPERPARKRRWISS